MGDSKNATDWSGMSDAQPIVLSDLQVYSYTILGVTSLLAGLVLLLAYARVRVLREPPGMLIFWQCVGQTMVDFHWAYAGLFYVGNSQLEDSFACRFHGLAALYCYFLTWNYTLALSLEIFSKVRNPLRHSYRHKSWVYHSASQLSCIALTVAVGSTGASGIAVDNTCFIRDGSWAESLMLLLVLFYFPLCVSLVIAAIRQMRHSPAVRSTLITRYMWFVIVCCILYAPSCLDHLLQLPYINIDNKGLREAAVVMGSSAGLILDLMRLYDPSVIDKLKQWLCRNSPKRSISLSESSPIIPLFEDYRHSRGSSFYETLFFQQIIEESVISTLISLNLIYDKLTPAGKYQYEQFPQEFPWPESYYTQENTWKLTNSDLGSIPGIELLSSRSNSQLVPTFQAEITERAPLVLSHLKRLDGISNLDLARSFSPLLNVMSLQENLGNRGGRSDSFLYYSYDRRFLLKTLSKSEANVLKMDLLPDFHRHKAEKTSLLSSIYGIFSIKCNNSACFEVIILRNIVQREGQIVSKYDIKGSVADRKVLGQREQPEPLQVCKDVDFRNVQKELYLGEEEKRRLYEAIQGDVGMLRDRNIMDYSLLVAIGVRDEEEPSSIHTYLGTGKDRGYVYYIGLIDFLQVFNRTKRFESFSKQLRGVKATDLSAINSDDYAARFLAFLEDILRLT